MSALKFLRQCNRNKIMARYCYKTMYGKVHVLNMYFRLKSKIRIGSKENNHYNTDIIIKSNFYEMSFRSFCPVVLN